MYPYAGMVFYAELHRPEYVVSVAPSSGEDAHTPKRNCYSARERPIIGEPACSGSDKAEATDEKNTNEKVAEFTRQLVHVGWAQAFVLALSAIALVVQSVVLLRAFRETRKAATSAAETVEVSREIANISRENDRAYISGGGWLFFKPDGSWVLDKDGNRIFAVSVDNYGKTPGDLRWYAFEFCARDKIPMIPKYAREGYTGRREFFDRIAPGTMGRPIDEIPYPESNSEVVYGRHWFVDIWGKEHSSGFILDVTGGPTKNTVPNILPPSRAYTDMDTCLGDYRPTKKYKRGDRYEAGNEEENT